jgi:hypothetical protein
MSLADALSKGPQKPSRPTFMDRLEQTLPPEEFEALKALLDDPEWSADAISSLLAEIHDFRVSATTIRTWRREHRG